MSSKGTEQMLRTDGKSSFDTFGDEAFWGGA
jgi:hypothetical protein